MFFNSDNISRSNVYVNMYISRGFSKSLSRDSIIGTVLWMYALL